MINRYPDIKVLAHKDMFSRAMRICLDFKPDHFDFIPPTFHLPNDQELAKFQAYQSKNVGATFIAKPQVGA